MLGALLIQPQMLARLRSRTPLEDLIDEAFALAHRLMAAPARAGELAPACMDALQQLLARLRTRLDPGLPAFDRLARDAFSPLIEGLTSAFGGATPQSAADLFELLEQALQQLEALPAALSDERIRAGLQRVGQVLSQDLGLNQDLLRNESGQVLAQLAASLRGLQDVSVEARATAEALACLIDRVRLLLLPNLPQLDFNIELLIGQLLARLRASGFDALRAKIGCLLGKARAVLHAAAELLRAVPAVSLSAGRPRGARPKRHAIARAARDAVVLPAPPNPRADDKTYCWYASWLYAHRLQSHWQWLPGYPGDEVWLNQSEMELALRTVSGADISLYRGGEVEPWYRMAPFGSVDNRDTRFSFGVFPAEFLEIFTRVSAAATDTGKGIWHLVNVATSPQEYGQLSQVMWNWFRAIMSGASGRPLASFITHMTEASIGKGWCITPMITWLLVIGFAFEGVHSETGNPWSWIGYFATLLGGDALHAWIPDRLIGGAHDLAISLMTLINQTGPVQPGEARPANFEHGLPLVELVHFLFMLFLVLIIPRHFYAYPGYETTPAIWAFWLLAAPALGLLGSVIGALLVQAIARQEDRWNLARQAGWGALRGLRDFMLFLYLFREGDTANGTYTIRFKADGSDYTSPPHDPFDPYPEKASSPYKLPYAAGVHYFVGQAHMGLFSHMPLHKGDRPQIYAVDFAHDFRDEVLASRDGTVVDWYDFVPDDIEPTDAQQDAALNESILFMAALGATGSAWRTTAEGSPKRNFVLVRHDTRIAAHDKTFAGADAFTYSMYMHGATGGVRQVFKDFYGKDPQQIIGTRVQQGNPIMLAGDTGMSMHNHLHMQVQPGPQTSGPARVMESSVQEVTLPFVFADIDESDGVPRRLNWYRSGNGRTEELPP